MKRDPKPVGDHGAVLRDAARRGTVRLLGVGLACALALTACRSELPESGGDPAAAAGLSSAAPGDSDESPPPDAAPVPAVLERLARPFTGDLPEIRERRYLRVLVSYSKTNFFFDNGRPRGFEHELMSRYAKALNRSANRSERLHLVFVPTPFERLIEDLLRGRGDVAAAGLTVTPERAERVAFTEPYLPRVDEVVVMHRGAGALETLEDLAGRRVYVRAGSSYAGHLEKLSRGFAGAGRPPIEVIEADPDLATEDVLELVNAGVVELTVADRHLAAAWSEVLPEIVVRGDLAVHQGGAIAWAVRRENPELRASLDAFVRNNRKGSLFGNILFNRYYRGSKWIANPLTAAERAKLEELIAIFRKYAEQYGFDWLALAAQGYQESGLEQGRRSSAGAIGIMQIKPSTAADKNVGVADIHLLENNIHAGAKYLAFLRDRYFDDPAIEPAIRVDFAWAAYNAGPARVRRLRRTAAERGLDPDRWFYHVEQIAAEEIGRETVDYVANINKYYAAYRLQYASTQRRQQQLESGRGENEG